MSLKQKLTKASGFSLIEVVIVLAIAGLIFVIVFMAVGQAQAARRDTQRKNEVNRLKAAVDQYSANNNGAIPTTQALINAVTNATTGYVRDLTDPSTGAYTVTFSTAAPGATTYGVINYGSNSVCTGTANARNYALRFSLERGGAQCVDNQ